jgi:hypothetical protein
MSVLKSHITRIVQSGTAAISTPKIRFTISNAFANDDLYGYDRSPDVQLGIRLEGIIIDNNHDGNESVHLGDGISAFS